MRKNLTLHRGALPLFLLLLLTNSCQRSLDTVAPPPAVEGQQTTAHQEELPGWPLSTEEFSTGLTNPYLAFAPGKTFYYAGETDEGLETIVVEVTHQKKTILGVPTTVVHDRAYLDGELIEDTYDWIAEDKHGNVWYFGEDSREIEDGQVVSTEGSWEAGVDGALPGILMPAQPRIGMKYQQEFYEDVAEDMAQVLSLSETVHIGLGTFSGVLETMEWTPLEPGHREHKFYKPGLGLLLEQSHREGGQRIELVEVEQ